MHKLGKKRKSTRAHLHTFMYALKLHPFKGETKLGEKKSR
jgi:hypothetical protein